MTCRVMALVALTFLAGCEDKSFKLTASGSHDCAREPRVAIQASNARFQITGTCERVSISGTSNRVTIAAATELSVSGNGNSAHVVAVDSIRVTGSKNVVTYQKGLTKTAPSSTLVNADDSSVSQKN